MVDGATNLLELRVKQMQSWILAWAKGQELELRTLFASDLIFERFFIKINGVSAFLRAMQARQRSFENPTLSSRMIFSSATLLVVCYEFHGPMIRPIGGMIPTGSVVRSSGLMSWRWDESVANDPSAPVQYVRDDWDACEVLTQLGALKIGGDVQGDTQHVVTAQPRKVPQAAHRSLWAQHWHLTPRLAQMGVLLLSGVKVDDVAALMGVAPSTAHSYLRSLYAATGVHSRLEFCKRVQDVCDHLALDLPE